MNQKIKNTINAATAAILFLSLTACSPTDDETGQAATQQTDTTTSENTTDGFPYAFEKVADNTWVMHGPRELPNPQNKGFMNNPGIVETSAGLVIIDPGSTVQVGRNVLAEIKKISEQKIVAVFNTHIHGDHWLGNHAIEESYPDAIFMAHPEMIKLAKKGEAEKWISSMLSLTKGATKGTKAVIPSKEISDTTLFRIGGIDFSIYAPDNAHSHTDIMIHVIEDSVVFLGDNVLSKRLPRLDDASFRGSIKACDIAIKIAAKHYVPGHGISDTVSIVKTYKDYLSKVYSLAASYYDEGLSDFEMKPEIVKKLAAYHNWANFDDEVGKHISLAVLEAEAAAFE